jgi:carboxyl-terminal processing protease
MNKLDRYRFLVSGLLVTLMTVISGGMAVYVYSDPGIPSAMQFMQTAELIANMYPDQSLLDNAADNARDAMFDELDRYSSYVPKRGFEHFKEEREGQYVGIGVSVSLYHGGLLVADVKQHGPADSAGVLAGDLILGTDSIRFAEYKGDPTLFLRGDANTKVNVIVYRSATDDTLTLPIIRNAVPLSSVPYCGRTTENAIYVRLLNFDAGVSDELETAIDSVLNDETKTAKPTGLILDLRGNPGGMFYEARRTASLFLTNDTFLVGTKGKSIWNDEIFYASGYDITEGLPMVVLCDANSASAAEIVSGALQKAKRAVLIGDTTFGKGLVQGYTQFPEGDGIRLTISRYYFSDGQYLNQLDSVLHDEGSGLIPDFYLKDEHPLVNLLDNSYILLMFAAKHQDELIDPARRAADDSLLLRQLQTFAERKGVRYQSDVAEAVNILSLVWQERYTGKKLPGALETMVDMGHLRDSDEYQHQAKPLLRLLKQYAVSRKEHEYQAYKQVIVKEDPLILFAESFLRELPKKEPQL